MGQRVEGGAPPHSRPTLRACPGSTGEPGFLASAGRRLAACLVAGTITLVPTCPCLPSPAPAGSSISLSGYSGDWHLERLSPMSQHHMSEVVTDPCVIYRSICREEVSAPSPSPQVLGPFPTFPARLHLTTSGALLPTWSPAFWQPPGVCQPGPSVLGIPQQAPCLCKCPGAA